MNIIRVLIDDHRSLQKMVEKVHKSSERAAKTREEFFLRIKHEASIHEKGEERFFYSLLREHKDARPDALEHYQEVQIMNRLLRELSNTDAGDEIWTAKFTVLKEITDHHIEEEEDEIFPEAERLLSSEQLEKIGEQFLAYKARYKKMP